MVSGTWWDLVWEPAVASKGQRLGGTLYTDKGYVTHFAREASSIYYAYGVCNSVVNLYPITGY